MATIMVQRRGPGLVPVDKEGQEAVSRLPFDKTLKADVVVPRNIRFHRLVFSLLQLTFEAWEPETLVSEVEKQTCIRLAEFLASKGVDQDACYHLTSEFLQTLECKRAERDEMDKSFDAFRTYVTIKAGYYREIQTPSGPKKEPVSWSFSNMGEEEFRGLYRAVFGVCWDIALNKQFSTQDEAENTINAMLGYA